MAVEKMDGLRECTAAAGLVLMSSARRSSRPTSPPTPETAGCSERTRRRCDTRPPQPTPPPPPFCVQNLDRSRVEAPVPPQALLQPRAAQGGGSDGGVAPAARKRRRAAAGDGGRKRQRAAAPDQSAAAAGDGGRKRQRAAAPDECAQMSQLKKLLVLHVGLEREVKKLQCNPHLWGPGVRPVFRVLYTAHKHLQAACVAMVKGHGSALAVPSPVFAAACSQRTAQLLGGRAGAVGSPYSRRVTWPPSGHSAG